MRGNTEVISTLNALLTNELAANDQYFIQGRMLAGWGYSKLHERISHESEDERMHATKLVERILFLGGQPDVAARAKLNIGENPKEMLANDLEFEKVVAKNLNEAIVLCREKGDNGTREMLAELLHDTEMDHLYWFEQQLRLIDELGLENYLQEMF